MKAKRSISLTDMDNYYELNDDDKYKAEERYLKKTKGGKHSKAEKAQKSLALKREWKTIVNEETLFNNV
ncbi:unnamed protein product [Meloidogyne enterolobii]|uniref:Uncharacterized protein n=1 Tax=Meloidogyne enterolobii TaxID=390850 RepID=A0ACB1A1C2_MELEN